MIYPKSYWKGWAIGLWIGGGGYLNELTNSTFRLDFFLILKNKVSLSTVIA
jgi:hypothetical protein